MKVNRISILPVIGWIRSISRGWEKTFCTGALGLGGRLNRSTVTFARRVWMTSIRPSQLTSRFNNFDAGRHRTAACYCIRLLWIEWITAARICIRWALVALNLSIDRRQRNGCNHRNDVEGRHLKHSCTETTICNLKITYCNSINALRFLALRYAWYNQLYFRSQYCNLSARTSTLHGASKCIRSLP